MLREAVTGLVVALPFGIGASAAGGPGQPEPLFRFEDPAIVESSGLAVVDGLVVTVNDSGDEARVFAVDPGTGRTVGVTRWAGDAVDVEALAPAGDGEVWVGDIGDNAATRGSLAAVRVPVGRGDRSIDGTRVSLVYPDGPVDAEALLAHPRDGRLVVVTKGIFGGRVYVAPRGQGAQARLRQLGQVMSVVTDGAFFPDGRHLVLRDYSRARVYTWPGLESVGDLELPAQQQGEGIAVTADGRILVSTEGSRSPVHEVALPQHIVRAMSAADPAGDPDTGSGSSTSRERRELPEEPAVQRDPTQWLIGTGVLVVALLVLWRALRPR